MSDDGEYLVVPILVGFDSGHVIGQARIRKDALPEAPDYSFSIGFLVDEAKMVAGDVICTKHTLEALSLIPDVQYLQYLRAVGKLPPEQPTPTFILPS